VVLLHTAQALLRFVVLLDHRLVCVEPLDVLKDRLVLLDSRRRRLLLILEVLDAASDLFDGKELQLSFQSLRQVLLLLLQLVGGADLVVDAALLRQHLPRLGANFGEL